MDTRRPTPGRLWDGPGSRRLAGLALAVLLVGACLPVTAEEGDEVYLGGTSGPYRGRVVDANTKQPIAGAVVLAVWYVDVPALVQTNTQYHDAMEVLTDPDGSFVLTAPAIEQRAPRRTRFPVFTIFKLGYLYFRGYLAAPEVMADRANRPLLAAIELQSIAGKGRRERQKNLGVEPPSEIPPGKIPNLIKAFDEELAAIRREAY